MNAVLDIVTIALVVAGAFFFLAGTVGVLRFPDPLSRLHALTKADSLGLGLVALGLLPQADSVTSGLKLCLVLALVLFAGATASQIIARVAREGTPKRQSGRNEAAHPPALPDTSTDGMPL